MKYFRFVSNNQQQAKVNRSEQVNKQNYILRIYWRIPLTSVDKEGKFPCIVINKDLKRNS